MEHFYNKYLNQTCFILGSGPSIKDQDLSLLKHRITFCSNWFINHIDFPDLNIDFYCSYDNNFVFPRPNSQWLNALTHCDIIKFFPLQWKKYNLPLSKIIFIKLDLTKKIYEEKLFSSNPVNGFYDSGTVVINICIPLAIFMGFKKIILMGCDCNYHIKEKKVFNPYFYDFKDHHTHFEIDENQNLEWQNKVLLSYRVVQEYALQNNISILNGTAGGNLNVFDRIEYNSIF